jgi:hypothetical protein
MKNSLIVSVFALLLSSVALVTMFAKSSAPEVSESVPLLPVAATSTASLLARIEALDEETRELREQLALAQPRAVSTQRAPVMDEFVSRTDFEAFQGEVRSTLATLSSASSLATAIENPEFKDKLAGTLQEIRKDEAVAAIDAKQQARLDRLDGQMVKLEAALGLTTPQSSALRAAFVTRIDREADLTRRWKQGEDVALLGQVKQSDQTAHEAELSGILTPDQIESYGKLVRQARGGK